MLYLVRHGQTAWNQEKRFQGHADIELCKTGLEQAEKLRIFFQQEKIQAVYSSPLRRANYIAEQIALPHNLKVATDSRLKELDQGNFEGLRLQDVATEYKQFMTDWFKDPARAKVPGGETLQELQKRATIALNEILDKRDKKHSGHIVIVSHNLTIRSIICSVLNLPLSSFRKFTVDLASITKICDSPWGLCIEYMNHTKHLTVRNFTEF